jgi:hypothetical protein
VPLRNSTRRVVSPPGRSTFAAAGSVDQAAGRARPFGRLDEDLVVAFESLIDLVPGDPMSPRAVDVEVIRMCRVGVGHQVSDFRL